MICLGDFREIRQRIDNRIHETGAEAVADIHPDVLLLQDSSDFFDCTSLVTALYGPRMIPPYEFFEETDKPRPGNIVFYVSDIPGEGNVGIYCGDEMVISKWGKGGPLFIHPMYFVPTQLVSLRVSTHRNHLCAEFLVTWD